MTEPGITIRPFVEAADYEACIELQRATWGDDFRELVPPAMLKVSQKVGGVAAGAFDADGGLVGFVYGLTGMRDGHLVHWSHMLAVRVDARDSGLGQRLKHWQREQLVEMGVKRMLWTYDPLVARNAHLNLNRLGACPVEYVVNMYGLNPRSKTDSVIGTDRFIVEWRLDVASNDRSRPAPASTGFVVTADVAARATASQPELRDAAEVRIEIPADIQMLKEHDPEAAAAWRATTRRAFTHYLPRGYVVVGLMRDEGSGRRFYVVRRGARP